MHIARDPTKRSEPATLRKYCKFPRERRVRRKSSGRAKKGPHVGSGDTGVPDDVLARFEGKPFAGNKSGRRKISILTHYFVVGPAQRKITILSPEEMQAVTNVPQRGFLASHFAKNVKKKKDIKTVNLRGERPLGTKRGKKGEVKKVVSPSKFSVQNDARKSAREKKVQKVLEICGPTPFKEKTKF